MRAVKRPTRQRVWNGREERTAEGTLEPLLIDGKQPTYSTSFGNEAVVDAPVFLFNSKRNWWLNYGKNRNTGHFESKKGAILWWVQGGR